MLGISVGNDAKSLVAESELGVSEERVVGGGNEATCHFEDGLGGPGFDSCCEFLGFGFQLRVERL